MKELKVHITFLEELLGTAPADKDLYTTYIGSNAPDAPSLQEEIEATSIDDVVMKGKTVFPRDDDGTPILWDYQIKGFFKDACGMLTRVKGTESNKIKAYRKIIDGLIFIKERKIRLNLAGEIGDCQRPLRSSGPNGERVALANSEKVPAGTTAVFTITFFDDAHEKPIREWLDYGKLRGLGQWRNSSKGRFAWREIE